MPTNSEIEDAPLELPIVITSLPVPVPASPIWMVLVLPLATVPAPRLIVLPPVPLPMLMAVKAVLPGPIFKAVVAPPPKLIVVAVVFKRSKEVEAVTREVVMLGEIEKTANPPPTEPVSSETVAANAAEVPVVARLDEPSVVTNLEAVKPEKLMVPDEVMPVAPVIAPAPEISKLAESKTLSQFAPIKIAVSAPFEVVIAPIFMALVVVPAPVVAGGTMLTPFIVPPVVPAPKVILAPLLVTVPVV